MDVEWIKKAITDGKFKLLRSKFLNDDAVLGQVVDGDPKIYHDLILHAFYTLSYQSGHRRKKYDKIILRFLKAAKDVHFGWIGGTLLLMHAVSSGTCYENICHLIKAGSDVNATENQVSVLKCTLFEPFTSRYDINIIKALIDNGADVNYEGLHGLTPLFTASQNPSSLRVIPMLVAAGANILHRDNSGMNILMHINCSCFNGTACNAKEAVDLFIKKGGNLKDTDLEGNTVIHHSCCKYIFDLAVRSSVSIETKNNSGHTALMAAASYCYYFKVYYLLLYGADPNCTDFQLNTPLHSYACGAFHSEEMANLFLYYGGNWKAQNISNRTPLDILLNK